MIKKLSFFIKSANGRNNHGKLVFYRKGGGYKFFYPIYDRFLKVYNLPYIVVKSKAVFYKSFFLDLVCYGNGYLSYVKSTEGVEVGTWLINTLNRVQYNLGDNICLKYMTLGTLTHNIEIFPGAGSSVGRSKGVYCKVICQYAKYTLLELPSKKQRLFFNTATGIIGKNSFDIILEENKLLKAGDLRKQGRRPKVRGIAKNAVDHPNGGNTKGGSPYKDM